MDVEKSAHNSRKRTMGNLENEIPKKKRSTKAERDRAHNVCYHCGNNSAEDSYFSIPNGITRIDHRAKWLRFLQLTDAPPRAYICSKHFREEDIKFSVSQRRKVIKRDSVPSIQIPKCKERKKRKDGIYKCYYCEKSDGGNKCYFKFPEDPNLFQKWVDFCDSAPELILPSYRLCSDHFEKNLIIGSMERNQRRHLQEDAVPTIKMLPTSSADNQDINMPEHYEIDTLLSCELISDEDTISLNLSNTPNDDSPTILHSDENEMICSDTENVQRPCTPTTPTGTRARDLFIDTSVEIPKYLGQIRSPHLSSPRRAKACFYKCREMVYEKDKQIRSLTKKLKRSSKKIQTLTDLVKHLRKIIKSQDEDE